MRDHGVDMPDPDPDTGGIQFGQRGSGPSGAPDQTQMLNNPKFQEAEKACRSLLPTGGGT
jgi:hypothetical protein